MGIKNNSKKKSHHATIVVRRNINAPVEQVFNAWVDPTIRRAVLSNNRYKNGVKEVNPIEGGMECYENRWGNRLIAKTTRRYVAVRRPNLIVAHVETIIKNGVKDRICASQELLLFKKVEQETELIVSCQAIATQPIYTHATGDAWDKEIDLFLVEFLRR